MILFPSTRGQAVSVPVSSNRQAVTKDLTSSSNFSGSCVLTFQTLPREMSLCQFHENNIRHLSLLPDSTAQRLEADPKPSKIIFNGDSFLPAGCLSCEGG